MSIWSFRGIKCQPLLSSIVKRYFSPLKNDPYKILGIDKSSPSSAIKKAYFELAKKYHPDTNKDQGAKEKFVEIQEAYDILSDDSKKAHFDEFGHESEPSSSSHHYSTDTTDPADIFKAFFGGSNPFGTNTDHFFSGTSRSASRVSLDIPTKLILTFTEAALGCSKTISIQRLTSCMDCNGSGITPGKSLNRCKACDGKGSKIFSRGGMIIEIPCDTCSGEGALNLDPCRSCSGKGCSKKSASVQVRIPSGVDESSQLIMRGAGHTIQGQTGNILLQFKISSSPIFRRKDNDLYVEKKVSLLTALLGGTIRIETLTGEVDLVLEEGIQPDAVKRLRGKGIYNESSKIQGDLYVTLKIEVPKSLSAHQRRLLESWDSPVDPPHTSEKLRSWIKKVC